MRLNGFTEYGLLILAHMSRHPGERVTARQTAAALNIPRNHLTKIVHALGKAGYLSTSRGRTGGLRLGRPAELITVGDVIRTMQPDFRLTARKQAEHRMEHPDSPACEVQTALQSALHAYFDVLNECTFADLASRHRAITHLHMNSPGALLIPSLRESTTATTV